MDAMLNGPFGQITLTKNGLTLGRAADNQLILQDVKASSHHARLQPLGAGYSIMDIGSTNGTFVNEQKVERNVPRQLMNGDVIRIGETKILYQAPEEEDPHATVPEQQGGSLYKPTMPAAQPSTVYQAQPAMQVPQTPQLPPVQQSSEGYRPYPQLQPAYGQSGSVEGGPAYSQPPVYGQAPQQAAGIPAYGQVTPGVPGLPPGYAATPTPQRRPNRMVLIVGGVVIAVVLIIALLAWVVSGSNAPTAGKTLDAFCGALSKGDTHTAYTELAPEAQAKIPETTFAGLILARGVSGCTHDASVESGSSATSTIQLAFTKPTKVSPVPVKLTKQDNGDWKISDLKLA